ncbi:MAG: glycosyltransferase family 2 protein [Muribaculaceae bacterium]|nr:glycosyltransferase family 2 protein [Muribaculaceae bacterium]
MFKRRLLQLSCIAKGYYLKLRYDLFGFKEIPRLSHNDIDSNTPQIIVSLTSYGRRVKDVVPYTLISLLRQTKLPDKIILWLDKENWNDTNLPKKLTKLKEYGVEIFFCEDIRSYKKLVPTLNLFPNDIIITVDDDVIYRKDLIIDLYQCYLKNPNDIVCNMARFPKIDTNNRFKPYESWFDEVDKATLIMPIGVSGVLYPPNVLYKDVVNADLFTKLSPLADDLWFWIMGVIKGTKYHVINQRILPGDSFDAIYQYLHRGASLTHQNRNENQNDKQLKAIIDYYNINFSDLNNITFTSPNN